MVCDRCKMVVQTQLENVRLHPLSIELGEVKLQETHISDWQKNTLQFNLKSVGFELLDDKKQITVDQIKNTIIHLIRQNNNERSANLSHYIAQKIGQDYTSLSTLFSEWENTTIEKFYIAQKIERVKELLSYNELNLSQIADELHYSSLAHLSNQFKKHTGTTPSLYKNQHLKNRKQIDQL